MIFRESCCRCRNIICCVCRPMCVSERHVVIDPPGIIHYMILLPAAADTADITWLEQSGPLCNIVVIFPTKLLGGGDSAAHRRQ